jgi:hypothetical protein
MRSIYIILISVLAILSASCKKDKTTTGDYIIVGHIGGFASISDFYRIGDGQLRHDTSKFANYPLDIGKLKFVEVMPNARYQKVAHLKAAIPAELLSQNEKTFGEMYPDAMGLEVFTNINGTPYHWSFAGDQSKTGPAIRNFINEAEKVFN